jgi:3'(2'), 5'-bisphosphate nucleotidase
MSASVTAVSASMPFDPGRYLDAVVHIARDAGERILTVYRREFQVLAKGDGSPLTEADQAAHAAIAAALVALVPSLPLLSEESIETEYASRADWKRFWLVDPLDGTKEFVSRNGEFTVNIALIEHGAPVLGVVHVPVTNVTYLGCRGLGAFRRDGAAPRRPIRARASDNQAPLRVVASRSHADPALRAYIAQLGAHELVSMGSSLKFCLIAEGAADVYPRLGPTMEWDTAAAQCVLEAAGGRVVGPDNQPLRYNKPSLLNPWLIASGAGDRDWTQWLPPNPRPAG